MKKFLFGTAGLLLIAASCSKNEVVEVNQDGNEIQFSVVANNATKAADIYCNNNMPEQFTVFAKYSDGGSYMQGDVIKKNGTSWVNQSGTRFWPNEGSLDFYAFVNENATDNYTWGWNDAAEGTPATLTDYTVPSDVAKHTDLLYAVKMEQSKGTGKEAAEGSEAESDTETTSPVTLNFRHALSQIVFQAKNTNPNLHVEISGVSIVGVSSKGDFAFPTTDTDTNKYGEHNGEGTNITYTTGWGVWSGLETPAKYTVELGETVNIPGSQETTTPTNLTNNVAPAETSSKALLLLPQGVEGWDPTTAPKVSTDGNYATDKGAYFLVDCAIYNIAGNSFDAENDTPLWGTTAAHKEAAIPVEIDWEQGKKYIYTFIFGEGGGYDPEDPDPDPDDPDPVLIPITFNVTVDDFVPVANEDIDMTPATSDSTEGQGE